MELKKYLEMTGESYDVFGKKINRDGAHVFRIASNQTWASRSVWADIAVETSGMVLPSDHIKPLLPEPLRDKVLT